MKNYYYVCIQSSDNGLQFITTLHQTKKYAECEWDKAPMLMSQKQAFDVMYDINYRGGIAFVVVMPFELNAMSRVTNRLIAIQNINNTTRFKDLWNIEI